MAHFITVPMRWRTFCAVACLQVQMGSSTAITSAVVIRSTPFRPRRGQAYSRSVACQTVGVAAAGFPRGAVDGEHGGDRLVEGRDAGGAAGGWARVAPRAGDPAVGEGAFAGLGQWHEGEAAEAERAALAVDDEPLHPVAGAGRFDVQVQFGTGLEWPFLARAGWNCRQPCSKTLFYKGIFGVSI